MMILSAASLPSIFPAKAALTAFVRSSGGLVGIGTTSLHARLNLLPDLKTLGDEIARLRQDASLGSGAAGLDENNNRQEIRSDAPMT